MSPDELAQVGSWADRLDNASAALKLPLPSHVHVEGTKGIIEGVSASIKAFVRARGSDPWGGGE